MCKQRIVVKVGTNVMTNKNNKIVRPVLRSLVQQIAELYDRDIMTVLVSSGSVIAGKEVLGESNIADRSQRRQVYSAIGQPRMIIISSTIMGLNVPRSWPQSAILTQEYIGTI